METWEYKGRKHERIMPITRLNYCEGGAEETKGATRANQREMEAEGECRQE